MTDNAALYVSIGSVLVAIGSLVVSILGYRNSQQARHEARQHTALSLRAEAINHLRTALATVYQEKDMAAVAASIQEAKSRADLVFNDEVRRDVERAHRHAASFARTKELSATLISPLAEDLKSLIKRMSEDAALR
jgi:hypothetical protein